MTLRSSVTGSIFLFSLCLAGALACSAEATDPYPPSDRDDDDNGPKASGGSGASTPISGVSGSGSGNSTPPPSTGGSGGSGTTGSAGNTAMGTAGTPAAGGATSGCTPQVGAATDLLIVDVDTTMSNAINMPRVGYWYTFADPEGASVVPAADPSGATPFTPQTTGGANTTAYYALMTGSGGKYAGLGFALNDGGAGMVCTYDVSAYTGISFYYKSSHPLRVALSTPATTPAPKGTCTGECENHHGKAITTPTEEWTLFTAKWTELTQTFGTLSAFDKTKVLQIQFQIEGVWNATASVVDPIMGDYDLAVDEITFTTN
jgi:hypothetical protein